MPVGGTLNLWCVYSVDAVNTASALTICIILFTARETPSALLVAHRTQQCILCVTESPRSLVVLPCIHHLWVYFEKSFFLAAAPVQYQQLAG
jgi:hypothetical protein